MSVTKLTIPRVVIGCRDVSKARGIRAAGAQVGYRRDFQAPFLEAHRELKVVNVRVVLALVNKRPPTMKTFDGFGIFRLIRYGGIFQKHANPALVRMHGGMDADVSLFSITFQLDAVVGLPFVVAMVKASHVGSPFAMKTSSNSSAICSAVHLDDPSGAFTQKSTDFITSA
jgi:hypothetical protein